MSRPPTPICGICQTTFASGDCVHVNEDGGTTDDPYVFTPIVSETAGNLVVCSPNGLGAFLDPIYLDPPACHVYSSLEQTVPYDTPWPLLFNEQRYDTDSMHDPDDVGQSGRITFKTAGVYDVCLNLRWKKTNDSTATGDLAAFIRRNGAEILCIESMPVPNGDSFAKQSVPLANRPFAAGDYIEALVKQDVILDDEPMNLSITVERMSPIFSAAFLRSTDGMNILGM